jgi:hypothetical protein
MSASSPHPEQRAKRSGTGWRAPRSGGYSARPGEKSPPPTGRGAASDPAPPATAPTEEIDQLRAERDQLRAWADDLAAKVPPHVDGDESQEALTTQWVAHVGLIHLNADDIMPEVRAERDQARDELLEWWAEDGYTPARMPWPSLPAVPDTALRSSETDDGLRSRIATIAFWRFVTIDVDGRIEVDHTGVADAVMEVLSAAPPEREPAWAADGSRDSVWVIGERVVQRGPDQTVLLDGERVEEPIALAAALRCATHSTDAPPEREAPNFEGHPHRACGEHRTVGPHRAWCFNCGEWCYPDEPCAHCELPTLRVNREAPSREAPDPFAGLLLRTGPDGSVHAVQADGISRIALERKRQVDAEGWTPENDDGHTGGELAWAAVCYAAPQTVYRVSHEQYPADHRGTEGGEVRWREPWPSEWVPNKNRGEPGWVPWRRSSSGRLDELVKAGALIAAEIDRLQRAREDERADRDFEARVLAAEIAEDDEGGQE